MRLISFLFKTPLLNAIITICALGVILLGVPSHQSDSLTDALFGFSIAMILIGVVGFVVVCEQCKSSAEFVRGEISLGAQNHQKTLSLDKLVTGLKSQTAGAQSCIAMALLCSTGGFFFSMDWQLLALAVIAALQFKLLSMLEYEVDSISYYSELAAIL